MMFEIKNIVEKYCPIMGSNMPININYDQDGSCYEHCLYEKACRSVENCKYSSEYSQVVLKD